jgi:pyruvate-ferredoxin/flavodoxin oxidoreductase
LSKKVTIDGNHAAAYAAYAFTDVAAIYPITPSSPMAELADEWSAKGKTNIFGQPIRVVEMQSEAGAAGAMHGSLEAGALTTTFTSSQGLLLMIPNIYKMVGELLPGVLHIAARALATHALSIFGDHQDVMACRQTGAALLASANAQEALDLGCVAHLSAISGHLPFIHFFDGFRTSHEYRNIEEIAYDQLARLVNKEALAEFRQRALSPSHPVVKGTAQNPDIYFQGREVQNKYFARLPDIVADYMQKIEQITGRSYKPFDYYGAEDAEDIIVAMGSVCDTIKETVDYLNGENQKVGLMQVRLYRPFSRQYFLLALPQTVKRIAVLDRTKEPGATGEPLYLDICNVFMGSPNPPIIIGGRYGLGSKDTTPRQIMAVFNNLKLQHPKNGFTIGIIDDVTDTSLPDDHSYEPHQNDIYSCKFWGLGSDGTVGANKSACQIIGEHTDLNVQAYFAYDSKKSGGTTLSHLRFGKSPIRSSYLVYDADYIACHNKSFINHYDLLLGLKKGGIFVLNCDFTQDNIDDYLPAKMKRYLAENDIKFYIINAKKIASEIGLGNRINMIMQSAFFSLTDIIDTDDAVRLLKESIRTNYGHKGQDIVDMNDRAVERGIESLVKIEVPKDWAHAVDEEMPQKEEPEFVTRIQRVIARNEGDDLPVSAFIGMEDGAFPLGTTAYEKRGIAPSIPEWQIDKCIQCGFCAFICPHATVRLFLLDEEECKRKPDSFKTKKATGKGLGKYQMRVQISPYDCTGCGNCADICPAKDKALLMNPAEVEMNTEADNWEFAMTLTEKAHAVDRNTVKGSQYMRPLLEFNGACPGCGETPYIRLLTQMFGERMMIANATGCSSIWGASAPSIAYTTNADGRGPAWANSLFEDNAEYGFGLYLGVEQVRKRLKDLIEQAIQKQDLDQSLRDSFKKWLQSQNAGSESIIFAKKIIDALDKLDVKDDPILNEIKEKKDYLEKRSIWLIGGDGWAYDIGYGGVDQVLSTGVDINLFVMDTEVYSNTGGQASKATPAGAVAKFAFNGKRVRKKDLGLMAITYGDVYVAQIAMGADMNQTIKAIREAEAYNGPSLIIAYSPCVSHGIRTGMSSSMHEEKKAVEAGYWHLYRYDPRLIEKGENPFQLDSKKPSKPYQEFLNGEIRYSQLHNTFPDKVQELFDMSEQYARQRYETYKRLAQAQEK